jgi:hypothetical protein
MENDELDDSTVVVSRTNPSVEEATVVTSSRQFNELDETTTTSGVGVISETSDVAPVPTFQPQPVVIEKPEISTVGPVEAVLDPTSIEENTRVSQLDDIVEIKSQEIVEEAYVVAPPVVTRTGASREKLMAKNKRRRSMNSMTVIIAVTIATLVVGGTLAVLVAISMG